VSSRVEMKIAPLAVVPRPKRFLSRFSRLAVLLLAAMMLVTTNSRLAAAASGATPAPSPAAAPAGDSPAPAPGTSETPPSAAPLPSAEAPQPLSLSPASPPAPPTAAAVSAPAQPNLLAAPPRSEAPEARLITQKWWFWTAIGAVGAGAALTIYLVARKPGPPGCPTSEGYVCPP
jgi:hypothetical protein